MRLGSIISLAAVRARLSFAVSLAAGIWTVDQTGSRPQRWSGVARRVVLVFLAVSVAQVLVFRWVPVPVSAFMVESLVSARVHSDADWKLRYHWVGLEQIPRSARLAV
ncbi:MAG: hypothetical protein JXA57_13570, partial [Armatimonadetes bacterium]|nr:hypothetical protein [Armatimonadota bacterium]